MYVWIEFLREIRPGVTDRTGDRTDSKRQEDSKRQDGQQETGQTARYRTGIESKCSARDWDGKDYLRIIPRVVLVEDPRLLKGPL